MKPRKDKINWKQVVLGRVPGILLGTKGFFTETSGEDGAEVVEGHSAGAVSDEMSFGEAFAVARAEQGAGGVFEWRGNLYATDTLEEWNAAHTQDNQDEIPVEQETEEFMETDTDAEENEVVIFGDSDVEETPEVMVIDIDDDGNADLTDEMEELCIGTEESLTDMEAYDTDVMDDEYTNDVI